MKTIERRLNIGDEVITVHPPKFARESDEEYRARLERRSEQARAAIAAGTIKIIRYGNFEIIPPQKYGDDDDDSQEQN